MDQLSLFKKALDITLIKFSIQPSYDSEKKTHTYHLSKLHTDFFEDLRKKTPEEITQMYKQIQKEQKEKAMLEKLKQEQLREASYFFNQPHTSASEEDFDHCAKMSYWTKEEALALLFGKRPDKVNWDKIKAHPQSVFVKKYKKIRELVSRAISTNELTCNKCLYGMSPATIKPIDFVNWCLAKRIELPNALKKAVLEEAPQSVDWKRSYEEERLKNVQLSEKINTLDNKNKKLGQEKAGLQRKLNTSNKILAAIIEEKFTKNDSLISNVRSCIQKQGIDSDDETIRDRYNEGLEIIKQKRN